MKLEFKINIKNIAAHFNSSFFSKTSFIHYDFSLRYKVAVSENFMLRPKSCRCLLDCIFVIVLWEAVQYKSRVCGMHTIP